ncbi:DivIVA domain-containing protein [Clostridium aminobutyricum]|uniref:DivIVA domain-containing protein n=1 Tax=Clostridium aminobutyricum TaxID=33953 RepID=A0A939D6P7_CLOAM|nr:DivIVA domain-containing protein [Clostridium aminobutyricum]MBN7772102.1 DivIVA domain-containing protein [Clostridium aminobutyricum]
MITPLDIQNKEFSKSVRGYKEEEVDSFLDLLTVDLEKLVGENAALKEEVARLNADIQRYQGSEGAVVETLEAAKSLMRDISASAEKRAEILLKNAQLDAELITREAKESIEKLTEESASLRTRFMTFKSRYKNLLESELERFDTLSTELFSDFGDFGMNNDSVKKNIVNHDVIPEKKESHSIHTETPNDTKKTMVNLRVGDGA